MQVLLIHVDGKMPNLPLMKLSAWHKKQGDTVTLLQRHELQQLSVFSLKPDIVHISCVFTWNKLKALRTAQRFSDRKVTVGGSGVDLKSTLPEEVEHIEPDYRLYNIDYSMGFTTRGCIRRCPWCLVPKKEGKIRDHALIDEFLKAGHRKLILLDNNFLAGPKCEENLIKIIAYRLQVSFTQGLDIRLVTRENARLLRKTRFYNWKFNHRQLYFSFDLPEIEDAVRRGVKILSDVGIKPYSLRFYVLTGFNTTFEEDMHRFQVLTDLGTEPFMMVYNNRKDLPLQRAFSRWVNRMIYKSCSWDNYKRRPK